MTENLFARCAAIEPCRPGTIQTYTWPAEAQLNSFNNVDFSWSGQDHPEKDTGN